MCICNGLDLIVLKLGEEKLRTLRCLKKNLSLLFGRSWFTIIPSHIFSSKVWPNSRSSPHFQYISESSPLFQLFYWLKGNPVFYSLPYSPLKIDHTFIPSHISKKILAWSLFTPCFSLSSGEYYLTAYWVLCWFRLWLRV